MSRDQAEQHLGGAFLANGGGNTGYAVHELAQAIGAMIGDLYPETIAVAGERVPVDMPRKNDAAKVEAFDQIAAFIGMAGRIGGNASASAMLTEVGNIIGRVKGVPSPNAEDTERHYRSVAPDRLSPKQLRMVGLGGAA